MTPTGSSLTRDKESEFAAAVPRAGCSGSGAAETGSSLEDSFNASSSSGSSSSAMLWRFSVRSIAVCLRLRHIPKVFGPQLVGSRTKSSLVFVV